MQACNDEAIFRLKLLVLSSFVHRNTLYETVLHFRFEAAREAERETVIEEIRQKLIDYQISIEEIGNEKKVKGTRAAVCLPSTVIRNQARNGRGVGSLLVGSRMNQTETSSLIKSKATQAMP